MQKTFKQTLENLGQKYADAIPAEDQADCPVCGGEMTDGRFDGWPSCIPCDQAKKKRVEDELEAWAINYRIDHLAAALERVGVPPAFQRCLRSNWRGQWPTNAMITDGDTESPITIIHGPVGSGKTHLGTALFADWVIEYGSGLWYDVGEFVEQLRNDINSPTPSNSLEMAISTKLLMLDDLGAERLTDFTLDRVAYVLRHRYNWMLPTIITTNLTPSKINEIDPRLMSRMFSGTVVKRTGKDYRFMDHGR